MVRLHPNSSRLAPPKPKPPKPKVVYRDDDEGIDSCDAEAPHGRLKNGRARKRRPRGSIAPRHATTNRRVGSGPVYAMHPCDVCLTNANVKCLGGGSIGLYRYKCFGCDSKWQARPHTAVDTSRWATSLQHHHQYALHVNGAAPPPPPQPLPLVSAAVYDDDSVADGQLPPLELPQLLLIQQPPLVAAELAITAAAAAAAASVNALCPANGVDVARADSCVITGERVRSSLAAAARRPVRVVELDELPPRPGMPGLLRGWEEDGARIEGGLGRRYPIDDPDWR